MKRNIILTGAFIALSALTAIAQTGKFCIAKDGKAATIVVDGSDWKGVQRAANDLSDDVRKVTGISVSLNDKGEPTVDGRRESQITETQKFFMNKEKGEPVIFYRRMIILNEYQEKSD